MGNNIMRPDNLCNIMVGIYGKDRIKKIPDQKGNLVYLLVMNNANVVITIDVVQKSYKYSKKIKEIVNKKFETLELLFAEVVPVVDKLMEDYLPS